MTVKSEANAIVAEWTAPDHGNCDDLLYTANYIDSNGDTQERVDLNGLTASFDILPDVCYVTISVTGVISGFEGESNSQTLYVGKKYFGNLRENFDG